MKFNEEQIKELEKNPNVLQILDNKIFYTPEFKAKAITMESIRKIQCQHPPER